MAGQDGRVKKKNQQRPHGRGTARGRRTAKIQFFRESRGKAARLFAAEQNGYEMLPLYAAAVIIAHATGEAAQSTVNTLSAAFLLLRAAYIWAYAQDKAALRSNIWYGCLMCIVALFIAAC